MSLKTSCDGCGQGVLGNLTLINGRYLCRECASNPTGVHKYYCNACHNFSPVALRKGNGWIEFVLYLCYFVPGIIYSIWRRSGEPTVCPICRANALISAGSAKAPVQTVAAESRDEVDCPFCAEKILARAKICKHCGKDVRVYDATVPSPL